MKTYAPKDLCGADLRGLMDELHATHADIAKFLHVTDRSVWRWLAEENAPYAVLAALWHETPRGREHSACDVGNQLVITRAGQRIAQDAQAKTVARLSRVLAISDTGAANDALADGPFSVVRRSVALAALARFFDNRNTHQSLTQVRPDSGIHPSSGQYLTEYK